MCVTQNILCVEFSSEKVINENLMAKISRFTVCIFVQFRAVVIPWCSGYHASLTHSRSPVRSRAESLGFFCHYEYFCTK